MVDKIKYDQVLNSDVSTNIKIETIKNFKATSMYKKSQLQQQQRSRRRLKSNTPPQMWVPDWGWLPGYIGGNGPILSIISGSGDFDGSLYIGGAFNNYGAVFEWRVNSSDSNVIAIGPLGYINGLVTSVVQVG